MAAGNAPPARGWALMYPELMQGQAPGAQSPTGNASPQGAEVLNAGPGDSAGGQSSAGGLFDFSSVLSSGSGPTGGLRWHPSATIALEESRREGKPTLILITHKMSKPAQEMENTLLLSPGFRELAKEKLVLLRVDYGNDRTRGSDMYETLKKQLKANGYPTLIMTLPDGTEMLRLSGYKSEYHDSYLEKITKAVEDMSKSVDERRKRLAREGYRLWKSRDGNEVFARLTALDANKATFMGEWGVEFKTFTNRLSEQDKLAIEQRQAEAVKGG